MVCTQSQLVINYITIIGLLLHIAAFTTCHLHAINMIINMTLQRMKDFIYESLTLETVPCMY